MDDMGREVAMMLMYVLWLCGSYILGSVSFGDIVAKTAGFRIRTAGTSNPGTANVFREMGLAYSALVLILDLFKGITVMLPVLFMDVPWWSGMFGAVGVLLGHFLPVFWGFRGGTGMVVAMGVVAGLVPFSAVIAAPVTLVVLAFTKNAGYSGAVYFACAAILGWFVSANPMVGAAVLLIAGLVMVKSIIQYGLPSGSQHGL